MPPTTRRTAAAAVVDQPLLPPPPVPAEATAPPIDAVQTDESPAAGAGPVPAPVRDDPGPAAGVPGEPALAAGGHDPEPPKPAQHAAPCELPGIWVPAPLHPPLTTEPQAFACLPRESYDAIEGINSSLLKEVSERTEFHGWAAYRDPNREQRPDTPAFRIGSLCHLLLLEPEEFDRRYIVPPTDAPRRPTSKQLEQPTARPGTKAHDAWLEANDREAWWVEFDQQAADRLPVDPSELEKAQALVDALLSHSALGFHFRHPDPEVMARYRRLNELTITWIDPDTGRRCKARLDALRLQRTALLLLDVKSAADADPRGFGRAAANYGYLIQGAFYLDGLATCLEAVAELLGFEPGSLHHLPLNLEFIAMEKEKPRSELIGRYFLTDDHLEAGRRLYRDALQRVALAETTGYWPGYSTCAQPRELPPW